jgi:hypothetical protein
MEDFQKNLVSVFTVLLKIPLKTQQYQQNKTKKPSVVCIPVMSALGRLKQNDLQFMANLGCTVTP